MDKKYSDLMDKIKDSYEQGVTIEAAERLAGEFLYALMSVVDDLRTIDLDSRMKKSGLKAIKAAVYLEAATKGDKKPSDVMLGALVDSSDLVHGEQKAFDASEAEADYRRNVYNVLKEAHIHYRGISRGKFE